MAILDIPNEAISEKYLGLPIYIRNSKGKMFDYLKDQVWKRILIKAIKQAIPTYAMSCFDLTETFCDDMEEWYIDTGGHNKTMRITSIDFHGKRCVAA